MSVTPAPRSSSSAMRRRMNARMISSLSSAWFTSTRCSDASSITRTLAVLARPAVAIAPRPASTPTSPLNEPGVWVTTSSSPSWVWRTMSTRPDNTTNMPTCRSPSENNTSPAA